MVKLCKVGGLPAAEIVTVTGAEVLMPKPFAPLYAAVTGWLPMASVVVEKTATPLTRATLEPPGMGVPLSRKVTVPRAPGLGATVAVNMTDDPPVVASGV